MFQRPRQILLFICCFTLPVAGFSLFNIGKFGMTPFKLATAVLLVICALDFAGTGRRAPGDPTSKWVAFYALAVTVGVAQGFIRGVPASLLVPESTTYFSIILFYALVRYSITDVRTLRIVMWAFVLGGVATGAPAVLGLQAADADRFTGLAGQSNVLGHDMAFAIPTGVALLLATRRQFTRLVLTGAIVVSIGALLLSLSRAAFGAAFGMWALWIYRSGRLDTIWYMVPGVAVLIGVIAFAPASVSDRIETVTDRTRRLSDGSIAARVEQFEFSARAIASNPLAGVGLLNFPLWAQQQPDGRGVRWVVHNSYLSVLAELGVLGFIPYVMILVLCWVQYGQARKAARRHRRIHDPQLMELGVYALFLQIALFGGLIEGIASIMQKSKAMWLIIALGPVVRVLVARRIQEIAAPGAAPAGEPLPHGSLAAAPGASWSS